MMIPPTSAVAFAGKAAAILDAYTTECLNKVLVKVKHLRDRFGKKRGGLTG